MICKYCQNPMKHSPNYDSSDRFGYWFCEGVEVGGRGWLHGSHIVIIEIVGFDYLGYWRDSYETK